MRGLWRELKWWWRDRHLGYFYLPILLLLACILWTPVRSCHVTWIEGEEAFLASVPLKPYNDIWDRANALITQMTGPASDDPLDYFRALHESRKLQLYARRYSDEYQIDEPSLASTLVHKASTLRSMGRISRYQEAFMDKHGRETFVEAREESERLYGSLDQYRKGDVSYASVWPQFWQAYPPSVVVALMFFVVRLRRKEFNVLIEFWRAPLAALVWLPAMFVYPTKLSPGRQAREAMLFASTLLTTFLSFGVAGMAKAQVKTSPSKGKPDYAFVIEDEVDTRLPAILTPLLRASSFPDVDLGGGVKIKVRGFSNLTFIEGRDPEVDVSAIRLKASLLTNTPYGGFAEVELSNLRSGANWLRRLYISRDLDDLGFPGWQMRMGRIFRAGGFVTPAPDKIPTAGYPAVPSGIYASGIQVTGPLGSQWRLTADVSGSSRTVFDDPDQFDHVEFSARAQRLFGNGGFLAGTFDLSRDIQRVTLDGVYPLHSRVGFRGAAYFSRERLAEDRIGAYAFLEWTPFETGWPSRVKPHVQADWRRWLKRHDDEIVVTGGVHYSFDEKGRVKLTLDYERNAMGNRLPANDRLMVRLQATF